MSCPDLVAKEARNHKMCRDTFDIFLKSATSIISPDRKGGPQNMEQLEKFNMLCQWLKNEEDLYSLSDLKKKNWHNLQGTFIQQKIT